MVPGYHLGCIDSLESQSREWFRALWSFQCDCSREGCVMIKGKKVLLCQLSKFCANLADPWKNIGWAMANGKTKKSYNIVYNLWLLYIVKKVGFLTNHKLTDSIILTIIVGVDVKRGLLPSENKGLLNCAPDQNCLNLRFSITMSQHVQSVGLLERPYPLGVGEMVPSSNFQIFVKPIQTSTILYEIWKTCITLLSTDPTVIPTYPTVKQYYWL